MKKILTILATLSYLSAFHIHIGKAIHNIKHGIEKIGHIKVEEIKPKPYVTHTFSKDTPYAKVSVIINRTNFIILVKPKTKDLIIETANHYTSQVLSAITDANTSTTYRIECYLTSKIDKNLYSYKEKQNQVIYHCYTINKDKITDEEIVLFNQEPNYLLIQNPFSQKEKKVGSLIIDNEIIYQNK